MSTPGRLGEAPPRAEPGYFGPTERPLLGWLHRPPSDTPAHATGVVICNPLGYEALCAHRSLRHFAEAAAALGYPALRFDYDGTGDSSGEDLAPDRLGAWQGSVRDAVNHLIERTGATSAILLGVQFGATVATLAAPALDAVVGIAAIAPVVNGKAWLRELRALQAAMGRASAPPGLAPPEGVTDAVGLLLGAETREAIGRVDLTKVQDGPPASCLVLDRDDRPANEAWCARLAASGATVQHQVLPGYVEMTLDPHEAQVPDRMISAFTGWLATTFPGRDAGAPHRAGRVSIARAAPGVEEEVCHLDAEQRLFGVVARPSGGAPTRALLLLNAGSNHHVGNGRMYVRFARRFARQGWLVLRYDVSGIGDSAPHPGAPENDVYTSRAVEDLASAIAFVRSRYQVSHIEVAGLCSGAYHGFKGAVAGVPLDGVTVINPLVFFWKEGMSLAYPPYQMVQAAAQYRQSALQFAKWRKLLRGQVRIRPIVEAFAQRASDRLASAARNVRRAAGWHAVEDLGSEVAQVVARGTALRFVFSVGDPGEALLRSGAGWALTSLLRRGQVSIAHLPGCDHSMSEAWMQDALGDHLARALDHS